MNTQLFLVRTDEELARKPNSFSEGFDGTIEWVRVDSLFDGLRTLQERSFDLIFSDLFLPDSQGLASIKDLRQQAPQTPVIALCHLKDRDSGVNAVKKGAHDFFCYGDVDAANLRRSVSLALTAAGEESAASGGPAHQCAFSLPARGQLSGAGTSVFFRPGDQRDRKHQQ